MNKTLQSLDVGGSGGAIYLPYLVLHHTAWSAQKWMSIFRDYEPSLLSHMPHAGPDPLTLCSAGMYQAFGEEYIRLRSTGAPLCCC